MTDSTLFSEALQITEPLLRQMTTTLRPAPKASKKSLQQLLATESAPLASSASTPSSGDNGILAPATSDAEQRVDGAPAVGLWKNSNDRVEKLEQLKKEALICTRCPHLVASRTQVVFGVGNPFSELMFVGEAPGEEEDLRGEPFVGRAGQLLTKIINAMDYERSEIYIANILKCRPNMPPGVSGNRKPKLEEMNTCLPWLQKQIQLIQPRVLVALGATAVEGLLGQALPMRETRGRWFSFEQIPLMVTYHPAYLLRNQSLTEKRKVWEDMLQVLEKLERPISKKQREFFLQKS